MFSSVCPSCGAPVSFRSTASATAICKFCKSTLVRDAETLQKIGKQGELFDDASRIQIGTGGTYKERQFTVIGRIQLQYNAGFWNEWFVLFPGGKTGWLSEASGIYAVMLDVEVPSDKPLPAFENVLVGQPLRINGQALTATDKRVAQCVAAEGELPFPLTERWQAKTIDFQRDDVLATLDYSEPRTALFVGQTVSIASLKFSLLKALEPNTLGDASIGKIQAKSIQALACASCGSSIKLVPSLTPEIICPQCSSKQTFSGGELSSAPVAIQALALEAQKPQTTLSPGDEGTFNGTKWTVLGVLVKHASQDTSEQWEEYLIYNPDKQFAWLIFANYQWQFGEVLIKHPTLTGSIATLDSIKIGQSDTYVAVTDYAAGSFNWKVKIGDTCNVSEYKGSGITLSRESTAEEVTWTKAISVNGLELLKSFGHEPKGLQGSSSSSSTSSIDSAFKAKKSNNDLAILFSIGLVLFTAPAWFTSSINDPTTALMIGLFALWLPLGFFNRDQD
jgi:Zn finger protein HypA/HybF involved in hydrogenase expression